MTAVYIDIPTNMVQLMHIIISNSAPELKKVKVKIYQEFPFVKLGIEGESSEVAATQRQIIKLMEKYIDLIPVPESVKNRLIEDNFYTLYRDLQGKYKIEMTFINHEDETSVYVMKVSSEYPDHTKAAVAKIKEWLYNKYAADELEKKSLSPNEQTGLPDSNPRALAFYPGYPPTEKRYIYGPPTNVSAFLPGKSWPLTGNDNAPEESRLKIYLSTEQRDITSPPLDANALGFVPGKSRHVSGNTKATKEPKRAPHLPTEQSTITSSSLNVNAPVFIPSKFRLNDGKRN